MKNSEIRLKNSLDRERAVSYLQDIVNSLKGGRIQVEQAEQHLTLQVPPSVTVEIKARQKPEKESISLKMSWRRHAETAAPAPDLKISAGVSS